MPQGIANTLNALSKLGGATDQGDPHQGRDVLKLLGLPTMTALLRQKRLRWVGHALRRDDGDLSKTEAKSELALSSKPWTKCVLSDMETLKIQMRVYNSSNEQLTMSHPRLLIPDHHKSCLTNLEATGSIPAGGFVSFLMF